MGTREVNPSSPLLEPNQIILINVYFLLSTQQSFQDVRITKSERPALIECLIDLWMTVGTHMYHLWKLRGSIVAATPEVQRTLHPRAGNQNGHNGYLGTDPSGNHHPDLRRQKLERG